MRVYKKLKIRGWSGHLLLGCESRNSRVEPCTAGGLYCLGTALTDAWLDLVAAGIFNALAGKKLQISNFCLTCNSRVKEVSRRMTDKIL